MRLAPAFIKYLNMLQDQEGNWWHKLVNAPSVFIALRKNDTINAYHGGASVGRIRWNNGTPSFDVHVEFLTIPMNHVQNRYFNLLGNDGPLHIEVVTSAGGFVDRFGDVLRRAALFGQGERAGENKIACRLKCVINMEATFNNAPEAEVENLQGGGRFDLVGLAPATNTLVITEAKLYGNSELVAMPGHIPAVCNQLLNYHYWLSANQNEIVNDYVDTIEDYRLLRGSFFEARHNLPLPVAVDPIPRLLIFGFDRMQLGHLNNTVVPQIVWGAQELLGSFTAGQVARVGQVSSVQYRHLGLE